VTFSRPSLADLIERAEGEVAARLGTGTLLRRGPLAVLARVLAGLSHTAHGHLDFVARQVLADTAEGVYLERHASIVGLSRKVSAAATGLVTFTGTNGALIPAGTVLRAADGTTFTTDELGTISGGVASLAVTSTDGGLAGNLSAGTSLALVSPVAGVNATATVEAGGLTGGTDLESDDALRARVLEFYARRPQGSAASDYEQVALLVPGVTRAFAIGGHFGAGSVGITFLVDDHPTSPIPDAGKVAEVQAAIDAFRPVTVTQATVFAPTPVDLDPAITLTPNTAAVQAAVTQSLSDLLRAETRPGGTLLLSHVREAISTAAGEEDSEVTELAGSPADDVTVAAGEILLLGVPVYT
jgi:uncharacterized phage protein gp47/JayE